MFWRKRQFTTCMEDLIGIWMIVIKDNVGFCTAEVCMFN